MFASKIMDHKLAEGSMEKGWLKKIEFKIGLQKLENSQATIEDSLPKRA